MKYIKRILGLPFYLALLLISQIFLVALHTKNWIIYGGEAVAYQKGDRETIYDIFQELKKVK